MAWLCFACFNDNMSCSTFDKAASLTAGGVHVFGSSSKPSTDTLWPLLINLRFLAASHSRHLHYE
jgi:hypothetical protein